MYLFAALLEHTTLTPSNMQERAGVMRDTENPVMKEVQSGPAACHHLGPHSLIMLSTSLQPPCNIQQLQL